MVTKHSSRQRTCLAAATAVAVLLAASSSLPGELFAVAKEKPHREEDDREDFFRATRDSRVGSLAGAIAKTVQKSGRASVGSFGANCANSALKAVAIANKMLHEMGVAKQDQALAAVPFMKEVTGYEQGRFMLVMDCLLMKSPEETPEASIRRVIATGNRAKLGSMAAAIKGRVKDDGVAEVFAAGPERVYSSVEAIMQASSYMHQDSLLRRPSPAEAHSDPLIAALPSFSEIRVSRDSDMTRTGLQLRCVKAKETKEITIADLRSVLAE
eukprot:TRINITY_DN106490_c0_g1_i1.p1 TRINITY_DN106490_c0_g1~~TRINITY_DN106490_c0_g1_i1.p1  ORF type:complete len:279 (+),score=49.57 TRINITY_DN106490_c0_g1_i1:28-837(+)